ncbi:MAG: sulfotransferase [Sulfuricaulis sp.]|uniref:sulfotransferase family protein n=1 Tax=Sulfuricaulis sp. TaxID=2003553 RepID=UPI0025FE051A|nr:sulfotransferase [Sulfuricaulis sp.]MCR4346054.1 sulfotransferase [Sulfuricaulis sp.]
MNIFMIGTQRSGSNLLRLMLNELPRIAAPHPPHILQRMMPLAQNYGDLDRRENFAQLVDDVCRLVELNPVPWEGVTLKRLDIQLRCRRHTLMAVCEAVYDVMAEAWEARSWCCKSLANIQYLPQIEEHFRSPRYIYLYRDGRDVACSFRKAVVGEKHFYHIAREWAAAQQLALEMRERIGPSRFISISYESLTSAPELTMRLLCKFLGVRFSPSMLEFYKSDEAKRAAESSQLWGNVAKPIMANNTRKFLSEASESDIRIFESVAGDVLHALGYQTLYVPRGAKRDFSQQEILLFNAENLWLKEEVLRRTSAEDLKRRDCQSGLIQEIRDRGQMSPPSMRAIA